SWPGCWNGLTVLGSAPINNAAFGAPDSSGGGCVARESDVGPFGGCDPASSSGALVFVRVDHALHGVRLLGVGRGTTVDYLEVDGSVDDGLYIHGGTVDLRHLALTANGNQGLEWSGGWRGRTQFLLVYLDPGTGAGGIHGTNGDVSGAQDDAEPRSAPS